MPKPAVELTPAEWSVIQAVWETEPCTAPAIQEKLSASTGWTYSTVRTLMDRMAAKGALQAKKTGKVTVYQSLITREHAQKTELFHTLKHVFNGALTPMVQCLLDNQNVDAAELAKIEALIKAHKKSQRKPTPPA